MPLACAAEAAALQDRFWEFHASLFEDPGHTDDPHLWDRVRTLGLDLERFERDRRAEAIASLVRAQTRARDARRDHADADADRERQDPARGARRPNEIDALTR